MKKPTYRIHFQKDGILFENVTPHEQSWVWPILNPDYFHSYMFYPKFN